MIKNIIPYVDYASKKNEIFNFRPKTLNLK